MASLRLLVVISIVITISLKYPAAVGEARNVEPDDEGPNPREKPADISIHRSVSRTLSIRPNSI